MPCVPRPSFSTAGISCNGVFRHCSKGLVSTCCSKTDLGEASHESSHAQQGPADVSLGKAAARKARRQPPSIIAPHVSYGFNELQGLLNNGALLIDKPLEWTSFDVCGKLRGTLKPWKVKKVGHAGTLDPMATGLLVVCTGAGTKFVDDYQAMEKEYSGTLRLGEGTPSYDAEMEVDQQLPWEHITDEDLDRVARQFVGDIMQVPPMYSAIKVKGQKLYNLARDGQTVAREERPVTIMSLKLWRSDGGNMASGSSDSTQTIPSALSHTDSDASDTKSTPNTSDAGQGQDGSGSAQGSIQEKPASTFCSSGRVVDSSSRSSSSSGSVASVTPNAADRQGFAADDMGGRAIFQGQGTQIGPHRPRQDVFFSVRCSKGTYIRSLVYDIGRALGTVAFMASLRRDAIGDFHVQDAWQLQDLVSHLRNVRDQAREAEHQAGQ